MLGSFPPLRGLSSYCLELSSSLADITRIEFISFKTMYPNFLYPGGDLKDDLTFPDVSHDGLRVRRNLTWYNPLSWIQEGLFPKGDVLHAQWWSLPLAPIYFCICLIFKLRGKPIVFTVHNVHSHDPSTLFRQVSRLLFRLADQFIVHTEQNRIQLTTFYGIAPARISLIPHGSLDFHVRRFVDPESIRQSMGLGPQHKVVLLFGAIRRYKGVDTALKAFAQVVSRMPECRLMIAGKLWEKWEPYQRLIDDLGVTEQILSFLDYIPSGEVYRYFCAADLVILPYHHFDSQSGVGSTAISFRKPMIVSDVGGLPELVRDRRFVVPPRDPEALANAIITCFQNPDLLSTMAKDADTVAQKLSWPAIARKTCDVYQRVLVRECQPTGEPS